MASEADFERAVERMNASPAPGQGEMLKLYGLFKQAKAGDASGPRPGMTKIRERAKFDAWNDRAGLSREEARRQYIELVDRLLG